MTQVGVKSVLSALSDEPTALPAFLHRDLAYLLALEVKDVGTLSPLWQARVERWKRLLCWWLLAEVEEQTVPIRPPLLDHLPRDPQTNAPVLDHVTWLMRRVAEGAPLQVGVLSPFVLVRPSPEHEDDARAWGETPAPWHDGRWPALLDDLLAVLARALEQAAPGGAAASQLKRLAEILKHHFERGQRSLVENARVARSLTIRHPRSLEGFELSLNRAGGGQAQPLQTPPTCAACHEVLLPLDVEVAVGRQEAALPCPRCGATVTRPLADWQLAWFSKPGSAQPVLGVWTERALYWADLAPGSVDSGSSSPRRALEARGPSGRAPESPPLARIEGTSVVFEYPRTIPAIALREVAASRRLTLRVAGAAVEPLSFETVAFTHPLWPGAERVAEGVVVTPLRPAYLDLLGGPPQWLDGVTPGTGGALRLTLRGLPAAVRFMPKAGFDRLPAAGLVVWPDPRRVGSEWKWYRLATDAGLTLDAPGTEGLRPNLRHSRAGLPAHAVLSVSGRDSGCTLLLRREALASQGRGTVEVELGVDFGTTNSLVYFAWHAAGVADERAFEPHRLREATFLACRPASEGAEALLDQFFPRAAAGDAATVPSELCPHALIHWSHTPCCSSESVSYMFKADPHAAETRRLYLSELVIHALIEFVARLNSPPGRLVLTAVFTHPLSVTTEQRVQFQETVRAVLGDLVQLGVISPGSESFLLDESTAGILSVGQPHASELLLAADLGGGTLDVSLGQGTREERDQIGSLECGGHFFLSALCERNEKDVHQVQRAIRSNPEDVRARLSKPGASRLLERYTGHLLFFLETMVASHVLRGPRPGGAGALEVKLHLLGNGWGFFRFLAHAGDDPEHVWEEGMAGLLRRVEQDLGAALGRDLKVTWARGERPPKHAVAHGALKLAQAGGGAARPAAAMALPAGVGFSVGGAHAFTLEWQELFGPATDRNPNLRDRLIDDTVTFGFDALQERLSRARVLAQGTLTVREADGVIRQRLLADQNRCGGVAPTGYLRGPLQLLVEHWTRKLGG